MTPLTTSLSPPPKKKAKVVENDVVIKKLALTAWDHYRNYLDSLDEEESGGGGDLDELQELIDMLTKSMNENGTNADMPHLSPLSISSIEAVTKATSAPLWKTVQEMLPILLSVAHLHLADHAISSYVMAMALTATNDGTTLLGESPLPTPKTIGKMRQTNKQEQDTTLPSSTTVSLGHWWKPVQYHLEQSLYWFPQNAATWSIGANVGRLSQRLSLAVVRGWYERAVLYARPIRSIALEQLLSEEEQTDGGEDGNEEESSLVKEWIELLLLHQVVSVEMEDEEGDEEEDEKADANETDQNGSGDDKSTSSMVEGEYSSSAVESTSRFMCALLWSMQGDHDRALRHLQEFPLTHRLHPQVWKPIRTMKSTISLPVPPMKPVSFRRTEGILPPRLLQKMRTVFAPDAAYWQESDYANRGYYSYFFDYDNECRPQNCVEEVIVDYLLPRVRQCLSKEDRDTICGFEWWIHTRPIQANLGHNLHFDTDESMLAREGQVTHPILSSVLYLSEGSTQAGTTLVFNQTPDSEDVATMCWQSVPKENSLLVFPGNMLHGVLPCPGPPSVACSAGSSPAAARETTNTLEDPLLAAWKQPPCRDQEENRLTFMVGFWTRKVPQDNGEEPPLYGPCGRLPPQSDDHSWVREIVGCQLHTPDNKSTHITEECTPTQLPFVSPAWEIINKNNPESEGEAIDDRIRAVELSIPHGIDPRFFVKDAPGCFRQSLMEKDE